MNGTKSFLTSMTFWGAFLALLAVLAKAFGIDVPEADTTAIAGQATDVMNAIYDHNWGSVLTTALGIGGTIFAIYGRFRATTTIR